MARETPATVPIRRLRSICPTNSFNPSSTSSSNGSTTCGRSPPKAIEAELGNTPPDAGRIEELSGDMQRHLDLFEQLLTGRDHLLGDSLTAADLVAFPFLKYARPDEAEDEELFHVVLDEHQSLGGRPRLAAWIERVDALPRA